MSEGILDTSIFIARERERELRSESLPDKGHITVVTWGELQTGLLTSPTTEILATRLETFEALSRVRLYEIDKAAATKWAVMRANLLAAKRKVNVNDLWIASIALAHGLPVYSRDGDYDIIAEHGGPKSIRI